MRVSKTGISSIGASGTASGSTFLRGDGVWATPSGGPGGEAFPVGAVYINVTGTNPATELGYGTWSAFGAGRVMVGYNSGDTDFDTAEETGGAKTVAAGGSVAAPTISGSTAEEAAHTHTYTDVPNHVHVMNAFPTATGGSTGFTRDTSMSGTPAATGLSTGNPTGGVGATGTTAAGSSHSHAAGTLAASAPAFTGSATSVVQPYIVAHFWKRTA